MCALTVTLSIKVYALKYTTLLSPGRQHHRYTIVHSSLLIQHLNSWLPYVNIGLIFCVICIYGLGPCEFLFACAPKGNYFISTNTYIIIIIHIPVSLLKLECLWLFLPTSSYKPGVLLLTWSVGLSTGFACSSWRCCSAILWWEKLLCIILFKIFHWFCFSLTFDLTLGCYVSLCRMDSVSSASWFLWRTRFWVQHFW